ncbi:MAG: acetate kinase [Oscillospiraceae bacterium]|nr:acetate kinase [Oscillospiraceae bacterium]
MNILVINAGSSSLKYQLIEMNDNSVLAKGLCERIGVDGHVKHSGNGKTYDKLTPLNNHAEAVKAVVALLTDNEYGVIKDMNEIGAVGHRVVHGGEEFSESALITDEVIAAIEACVPLAPLHNPPNLVGIRACAEVMPGVPQVAVFDTSFHQTMPPKAYIYALPYEYYTENKIRRYGFHGTSHRFVAARAAEMLNKPIGELKIITCHLGNGSSLAAIDGGRSVDTTMGLTPLEGVPMGTRSGLIDPAIVEYLCSQRGMSVKEVTDVLNKKSGMLGVSGGASDFRDLFDQAEKGSERAKLAISIFGHSVRKSIGALAASMGGIDVLVFTAGVGENHVRMRAIILEGLEFLGIEVDAEKNQSCRGEGDLSAASARVKTLVVPTNEELVIAMDTKQLTVNN